MIRVGIVDDHAIVRSGLRQYLGEHVDLRVTGEANALIANLQAGTCWINHYNVTPIELPFGGYKLSGLGRENGRAALEQYTQLKSVYVSLVDIDAPY